MEESNQTKCVLCHENDSTKLMNYIKGMVICKNCADQFGVKKRRELNYDKEYRYFKNTSSS